MFMKVEIWSDIVCPWCGIAFHRLHKALEQFEHADQVAVLHRSFQLNKHAPEGTWPAVEHMKSNYGLDDAGVEAALARIEKIESRQNAV